MERVVNDMFNNELRVGDMVCFVSNPDADWKQTKVLARKQISDIICTEKLSWLVFNDYDKKVSPKRVVKCY